MSDSTFFEILCRGKSKCGTFVSAVKINHCPKCRSTKVIVRSAARDPSRD